MFFFTRKNKENLDLSWLNADMHSHLIAGIDDGSPDLDTSIVLIKGLGLLGYKKLITTPHVLSDMYPNTSARIIEGLQLVAQKSQSEGIAIELKAAAEYFIDEYFEEELKNRRPLLTISGNLVLVEYSMITAPLDLQRMLFEMQIQGYQPVIAHPERYIYLNRNKEFFEELKNSGCYFQLNLLSLIGYYGDSVLELAEYLIKKNLYDYAGTDLHNERQLPLYQKLATSASLKKVRDSGMIKNHLL